MSSTALASEISLAVSLANRTCLAHGIVIKKFLWTLTDDGLDNLDGITTVGFDEDFEPRTLAGSLDVPGEAFIDEEGVAADADIDYMTGLCGFASNEDEDDEDIDEELLSELFVALQSDTIDVLNELGADDDDDVGPSPPPRRRKRGEDVEAPSMSHSLEYRRFAALADSSVCREHMQTMFEICVSSQWEIFDKSRGNALLGAIRPIQGHLLQMRCHHSTHENCTLVLHVRSNMYEVEVSLIRWLLAGLATTSTWDHYLLSDGLREAHNRDIPRSVRRSQ